MMQPRELQPTIRESHADATGAADVEALWQLLKPVFAAGETYCMPRDVSREEALTYWSGSPHRTFLAVSGEEIVGTYFLTPNQRGGGAHVCNCGFVTSAACAGRGVATVLLRHALAEARRSGFRAMQFNFVVSTNVRALRLWERHGFEVVGRLPGAFHHPREGFVDAFVMYRSLLDDDDERASATNEAEAAAHVWEYLCRRDDLTEFETEPADAILVLGSSDIRVATHAAELMNRGLARRLVCSGGVGTGMHSGANLMGWAEAEAHVFAAEARRCGVAADAILVEPESRNTGENIRLSHALLASDGGTVRRLILVQKPFMTRRAFATFKKQWPGETAPHIATSCEAVSFDEYVQGAAMGRDDIISIMVGDLQRMTLYAAPPTEFQVPQHVPAFVEHAGKLLSEAGFTANLIT